MQVQIVGHHGSSNKMLEPLLGSSLAPILFALALIAAGQSSTFTGTLAGQIVMEGHLNIRFTPWVRRLLTRSLAIIPSVVVIYFFGEEKVGDLLIFSQVVLSLQLGFAVIPLIHFVSSEKKMGVFKIGFWTKLGAWVIAAVIVVLNIQLVYKESTNWIGQVDNLFFTVFMILCWTSFMALLLKILFPPHKKHFRENSWMHISTAPTPPFFDLKKPKVKTILMALDFSTSDEKVFEYAMDYGGKNTQYIFTHIVESPSARVLKSQSMDLETRQDFLQLQNYAQVFFQKGYKVTARIGFGRRIKEIKRICEEEKVDVIVVGSHGHQTFGDILYGETISQLQHQVNLPIFVVR